MRRVRFVFLYVLVLSAEGLAIRWALEPRFAFLICAFLMHMSASLGSLLHTAWLQHPLSSIEKAAVLFAAFCIPGLGCLLAWTLPKKREESARINAHEAFERSATFSPDHPLYERSIFTGDFEKDLARELDIESYAAVLRKGDTIQKRSVLTRLADRGDPRSAQMIRRCLKDQDHEVRLYAHAEMERLSEPYEQKLRELFLRSETLEETPDTTKALDVFASLAEVHFAYAESGILDDEMAQFHYQRSVEAAHRTWENGLADVRLMVVNALSMVRLGDIKQAWSNLTLSGNEPEEEVSIRLARAEVAYSSREFDLARDEMQRVVELGGELPAWGKAIGVRS